MRCSLAATAIAFRRAQIAWFHAAQVYDEFLQHKAGIDHPRFQRVIAGLCQRVGGFDFADAVLHGFFPVGLRVLGERIDDPGRLVVKGDREAKATGGNKVQCRSDNRLNFNFPRME